MYLLLKEMEFSCIRLSSTAKPKRG